jgi:ribosomal protein L3 glutamine methyltransferase
MQLEECLNRLADQFEGADLYYGHGTDNAWDEAVYLVFSLLGLPFDEEPDSALSVSDGQLQRIMALAEKRIHDRIPVAYLVGEAWFAGLPFNVDARVLVPRSPIAELIANDYEPLLSSPPERVLDLCTGSGCIGIATAVHFPQARVDLADISTDALAVAQSNIERHQLQGRVHALQSDIFSALTARCTEHGAYDLIVSNPPYVSAQEVAELPAEYHREPSLGLLSDDEGLAIPLTILRQAADYLTENGVLVLELGYTWPLLEQRCPRLPVTWLEFEHGGEGVLVISRAELIRAKQVLRV